MLVHRHGSARRLLLPIQEDEKEPVRRSNRPISDCYRLSARQVTSRTRQRGSPHAHSGDEFSLMLSMDKMRLNASLNAKSIRRAVATIKEHGAANIFMRLNGPTGRNNTVLDARVNAQRKSAK
jgi:hypothetical protein